MRASCSSGSSCYRISVLLDRIYQCLRDGDSSSIGAFMEQKLCRQRRMWVGVVRVNMRTNTVEYYTWPATTTSGGKACSVAKRKEVQGTDRGRPRPQIARLHDSRDGFRMWWKQDQSGTDWPVHFRPPWKRSGPVWSAANRLHELEAQPRQWLAGPFLSEARLRRLVVMEKV